MAQPCQAPPNLHLPSWKSLGQRVVWFVQSKKNKRSKSPSLHLSSRKPKSKPAPKPKTPRKYNKKAIIALLIIAISSTLLLAPAIYYGNFTLQIAKLVFAETTAVGEPNPFTSGAIIRVEPRSVYDYTFSIETAGIFRTNDTSVSTAQGTASITIKISITTPSAQKTVFQVPVS